MNLQAGGLYHVYNRGNNSQRIFFSQENYYFFLRKFLKQTEDGIDVLAYCLMPNHFHFLISTPNDFNRDEFSNKWKILLSSYTRAINKQERRTGSLFQQRTKSKEIVDSNHALICFNYIHRNPVRAKLVSKMEDWHFSSFRDYLGKRNGSITNIKAGYEFIDLPKNPEDIDEFSLGIIPEEYRSIIF